MGENKRERRMVEDGKRKKERKRERDLEGGRVSLR